MLINPVGCWDRVMSGPVSGILAVSVPLSALLCARSLSVWRSMRPVTWFIVFVELACWPIPQMDFICYCLNETKRYAISSSNLPCLSLIQQDATPIKGILWDWKATTRRCGTNPGQHGAGWRGEDENRAIATQTSHHVSHALAHTGRTSSSLEKHHLPFIKHSRATIARISLSSVIYWAPPPPCKDADAKVDAGALVVTGAQSVRAHPAGRPVGRWVYRHTERLFQGWAWLNHAALGGVMALDYPGAAGLGHTPLLHRRPLGEGQRPSGAVQPGALQDPGQARAAQAAEWRPAAHGRIAQVTWNAVLHHKTANMY